MHGELAPGQALTLRGLGKQYGVSMTPAREAVRRLVAEGALSLSSSGRVATPELTPDRIEELAAIRALLEPELASRALPRAHFALIDRLATINAANADAVARQDSVAYIRTNLEFHRTLYLRAQAPAMLAISPIWSPRKAILVWKMPPLRVAFASALATVSSAGATATVNWLVRPSQTSPSRSMASPAVRILSAS